MNNAQSRKIIHIDMDAFYASIEQRDYPELRGKPIAVGGGSARGVVMTASYEARKFGVKSAMPGSVAARKCPNLIFVKSHMDKYREASEIIRGVFFEYTNLVEPLSLDEAYLDVTENKMGEEFASVIADDIRSEIFKRTGLTASAGVSYNKFLAKIASDIKKPNGRTIIRPDQAEAFLDTLPIEKFYGVGKVTAAKMRDMGITNGKTLREFEQHILTQRFGKAGTYYYHVCRGIDNREVKPNRIRKSVGVETTFIDNKNKIEDLSHELNGIMDRLMVRLEKVKRPGFTLTLKLKTSEFQVMNRSLTVERPLNNKEFINDIANSLLNAISHNGQYYRLIGLQISNFQDEDTEQKQQSQFAF